MKNRNIGIDLARTTAILGVVLVHVTGLGVGRFGVQLFFIISGFLLADLSTFTNKQFLLHRAFRLFPLSFMFILIFYLDDFSNYSLFFNLVLLQNLAWTIDSFPGGWSISSEWIFSLLLVVIRAYPKKTLYILLCTSSIISILLGFYVYKTGGADISQGLGTYTFKIWLNTTNPFINISFFLVGVCMKRGFIDLSRIHFLIGFLGLSIMLFFDNYFGHLLVAWIPVLAIVFSWCLKFKSKNRSLNKIISFIGKRTYGIFFAHFLFLGNSFFTDVYEYSNLTEISIVVKVLNFITVFSLSVIIGTFTYKFIEKPFMRFSILIEDKYFTS